MGIQRSRPFYGSSEKGEEVRAGLGGGGGDEEMLPQRSEFFFPPVVIGWRVWKQQNSNWKDCLQMHQNLRIHGLFGEFR